MNQKIMEKVIRIISREVKTFQEPAVTAIAEMTQHDPYRVLVSCLLSLRTKDETTAAASARLFRLAVTPEQMVMLDKKQIENAIYPVGFYRVKAENILALSRTLLDRHHGKVPGTLEELLQLKGVGRKTANIVLTYGFQDPSGLAVDVHVHVIANRLGWVKTNTPEQTEMALRSTLPKKYWPMINDFFVQFGQHVCLTLSPWCSRCAVAAFCPRAGVKRNR